jgi:hypothetical protein
MFLFSPLSFYIKFGKRYHGLRVLFWYSSDAILSVKPQHVGYVLVWITTTTYIIALPKLKKNHFQSRT